MMIEKSFKIKNNELVNKILNAGESGMGYHVVRVLTKNGKSFDNVLVLNGDEITGIYGHEQFPFSEDDIQDIEVTHLKKPKDFDQTKWLYLKRS